MRRGKPPQRKTPLKRGTKPLKRTPFKRNGKPLKRTAPKSRPSTSTGPSRDVVDAVYERAGWSCERDGVGVGPIRGVDHHIHHRRLKGRGGTDKPDAHLPPNLLLLCPPCHDLVHGPGRIEWERHGWIVPSSGDPALVPVLLWLDHYRYLTPPGGYSRTPTKEKPDLMGKRYGDDTPTEPTEAQRNSANETETGKPSMVEQHPLSKAEQKLVDDAAAKGLQGDDRG